MIFNFEPFFIVVVVSTIAICQENEPVPFESVEDDGFSLEPTIPEVEPATAEHVHLNDTQQTCECVLFYLCANSTTSTTGQGIFDVR